MHVDILCAVKGAKWAAAARDSFVVVFSPGSCRGVEEPALCLNVSRWDRKRLLCTLSYVQCAPMIMMDCPEWVHIFWMLEGLFILRAASGSWSDTENTELLQHKLIKYFSLYYNFIDFTDYRYVPSSSQWTSICWHVHCVTTGRGYVLRWIPFHCSPVLKRLFFLNLKALKLQKFDFSSINKHSQKIAY